MKKAKTNAALRAVVADIRSLVEQAGGTVVCEMRRVTATAHYTVPSVHAVVGGREFRVMRPTFTGARRELVDWLQG